MYFLLDLNYTLVANSRSLRGKGKFNRYQSETYRLWLIDLLRSCQPQGILLVTIRPESERELTLARIADQCDGWQPDDVFFSTMAVEPPVWKRHACKTMIFPKYGSDPKQYLAVESNLETHKMYDQIGIRGFKVFPSYEADSEVSGGSSSKQGELF